jgi:organic radical activating enzyme
VSGDNFLSVSEFFSETVQGEGRYIGYPAVFLRMKGCTLNCVWCDTASVWRHGSKYSHEELLTLMEIDGVVEFLQKGAHLVLTGGSPLLQQERLVTFLDSFIEKFNFKPFIEVENECVLYPSLEFLQLVDHWNCSPKLSNSGQKQSIRYKPSVVELLLFEARTYSKTVDFKFVISSEEDWKEVEDDFLTTGLVSKSDIILMPEGDTQEKLSKTREQVVSIAVREGVRFSDRLHITIWDKKTGV